MNCKVRIAVAGCALLVGAAGVRAQQGPPPPGPGHFEMLGLEGVHPGQVVTGAPFSATAVTETTQTLADGTQINRKTDAQIYRDSQGRFRRDSTMPAIGPLAASGQSHQISFISDPVAGTAYVLEVDQKVARQLPARKLGKAANADELKAKFDAHLQQEIANGNVKKEELGTQTINGISAQGTRLIHTIPAGQIGNDRPITVINERWYSPELQVVVKSVRTDPRFGTTTYTVTNLQKQEPAAALFAVPSDYTVKQGPPRGGPRGNAPEPPPAE